MSEQPHHESIEPPPSTAHDDGARPAESDDSAWAVAWRARKAHHGVRALRVDHASLRETIAELAASVGSLTGAVDGVKKLLLWALAIVGVLAVTGAARLIWAWISTLHH